MQSDRRRCDRQEDSSRGNVARFLVASIRSWNLFLPTFPEDSSGSRNSTSSNVLTLFVPAWVPRPLARAKSFAHAARHLRVASSDAETSAWSPWSGSRSRWRFVSAEIDLVLKQINNRPREMPLVAREKTRVRFPELLRGACSSKKRSLRLLARRPCRYPIRRRLTRTIRFRTLASRD